MWLLKDDNGALTYLRPNETLTVGRNKGDIILSDDGSISRVHAKITVKPVPDIAQIDDNTVPLSTCTVEDANSKYGNFIMKDDGTETKITEGGYALRHKDRIRFGLQNYIFTALYIPIITLTSGLNETEKNELTKIIDAIGGRIMYAWTPMCTHMTIETPTISEKLSCALANGTPIVPIDYWRAALEAFQNNEIFPETVEFAPSINNKMSNLGNVNVAPNPMRKTCFENLTFVHFTSKQYNVYNRMIKLAGGTSIKYGRQGSDLDVCSNNVVVVQLIESNTTQATNTGDVNYAAVCEQLGALRRRTIPESEIPLAILNCSTDKYCNPSYNYAQLFTSRRSEIPQSNSSILALDTQDVELPSTSGLQRHTQSDYVEESVEQSCPVNDMSASTASSSYHCDSIGSMKLVSLNYEKNLENELKKKSALAEISLERDREENVKIDGTNKNSREENVKIAGTNKNSREENVKIDGTNKNSREANVKIAGTNKNSREENVKIDGTNKNSREENVKIDGTNKNSLKRNREENVKIDDSNKRACVDISVGNEERSQKPGISRKPQVSSEDRMSSDEDICFVSEKISTVEDEPERQNEMPGALRDSSSGKKRVETSRSVTSEADQDSDVDEIDAPVLPGSKRKAQSYRTRVFESEEKSSSKTDDGETLRKQKGSRSDISPSLEVIENPLKRHKPMANSEQDIFRRPLQTVSKKRIDLAPRKQPNKMEPEDDEWTTIKDYHKTLDDSGNKSYGSHDTEVSVFLPSRDDPNNTSGQRLLRITDSDDLADSGVPKFGKCFRKRYTRTPRRVDLYDATDDVSWSSGVDPEKNSSLEEEATTSRNLFSNTSARSNKMLRV